MGKLILEGMGCKKMLVDGSGYTNIFEAEAKTSQHIQPKILLQYKVIEKELKENRVMCLWRCCSQFMHRIPPQDRTYILNILCD